MILAVLLALAGRTLADNLTVEAVTLMPGETKQVAISLENPQKAYAAFQFDLWLPDDVDVMEMILNDNRVQGHQLMYNKLGEGHYRIVALSTSANSFSGTSGELLRMTLNAFRTDDIHMDNIHFVTPDGSEQLFESLGVGDEIRTTLINNINNGKNSGKRTIYNLNGQRLSTPQKGLNVINGRKVVVK